MAKSRNAVLIVINTELRDLAISKGFKRDNVYICHPEIEFQNSKIATYDERPLDFLFIGRFHPQKGIEHLIKTWKIIQKSLPNANLIIAGGGYDLYSTNILKEITKCSKSIEVLGPVFGQDKWELFSRSKIFLFPSIYESLGILPIEAISVGTPVIGFDIPSNIEMFEGGISTVPKYDVNLFAARAINLYKNKDLWLEQQKIGLIGQSIYRNKYSNKIIVNHVINNLD